MGGLTVAKLTNKQIGYLEIILRNLSDAEKFIMEENIAVCRKGGIATTSLHYKRDDGQVLYEISKQAGSQLVKLFEAKRLLENFINPRKE